jgi:hypothetical protein
MVNLPSSLTNATFVMVLSDKVAIGANQRDSQARKGGGSAGDLAPVLISLCNSQSPQDEDTQSAIGSVARLSIQFVCRKEYVLHPATPPCQP